MSGSKAVCRVVFAVVTLASFLPQVFIVRGQDLVAGDSVAGGSSVFVFRESAKKPQAHFSGGGSVAGSLSTRQARTTRSNSQIAMAAKRRRDAASARRRQAVASANRKIALSNTLTAKAEGELDANQFDAAIANFRAALVQSPVNTRAKAGLSDALTGKGIEVAGDANNEASLTFFDEAIKLDPKNAAAYAKRGAIYDAKGQNDKALADYQKAYALDNTMTGLLPTMGLANLDVGQIAKAESYAQQSDAASVDTVDSRYLRAVLLFKENKNPEALAAFDRVLQLDGRNAMAQYYRGQIFDRMDQEKNSIAAYKDALAIQPDLTPASYDLGVAYYNSGDYDDAAVAYKETIQSDPNDSQAHANLASTYRQLEQFGNANAEYKVASAGINTPDLYSEWGYCLGKTDAWDKAVDRLNTADHMSPTAIDETNVGWGYYNAAAYDTANHNDVAAAAQLALGRVILEKAVAQNPNFDAAYLNLGSTENALGDFQAAVNALNIALNLHSNWIYALNQLGVGYRGMNDLVNAVATFNRVVDLDGTYQYGLFNLGEAYNASGDKRSARRVNDRLRKLNPSLSDRLDNVFSGKEVLYNAKGKIENKLPSIPHIPRPF